MDWILVSYLIFVYSYRSRRFGLRRAHSNISSFYTLRAIEMGVSDIVPTKICIEVAVVVLEETCPQNLITSIQY